MIHTSNIYLSLIYYLLHCIYYKWMKIKTNLKMTVDRTYVKRKRTKKRMPAEICLKRNDISWALWIERDGEEVIKIKSRPFTLEDLKRSSKDFEERHEVISAFLVVVNSDSTKKGTSVTRVDNKFSRCLESFWFH